MKTRPHTMFSGSPGARLSAAAVFLFSSIAVLAVAVWKVRGVDPIGSVPVGLLVAPLAIAALLICAAVLLLFGFVVQLIPRSFCYAVATGVLALTALLSFQGTFVPMALLMALIVVPVHALLGGGLGAVIKALQSRNDPSGRATLRRAALAGFALVSVGVYAAWLVWFLGAGSDAHLAAAPLPAAAAETAYAADPAALQLLALGEPGPYQVERSSYGLQNDSVDISSLLPSAKGLDGRVRRRYWGFDETGVPLAGVVWAPQISNRVGAESYPLVVMVHGNHPMHRRAELGYDYLGEQLASHGYIAVSVDQNFLNFSWLGEGYQRQEIPARAWLLLEHLRLWRGWSADPASPWFDRVDLSQIALVGHSRGGEAAAAAALFNGLSAHPDRPEIKFDYGFNIAGVVALAPSEGFYRPGGAAIELEAVDYLLLHGGHDGDVALFMGLAQYERVFPGADGFKALAYLYRGSHSGFSTTPAHADMSFPFGQLVNRAAQLEPAAQQRLTRLYVTAFVEASLRGRRQARAVLQRPWIARQLMSDEWVLQRYRDGGRSVIADFDSDVDPTVGSETGVVFEGAGLDSWINQEVTLRALGRQSGNRARAISWSAAASKAHFSVKLPAPVSSIFTSDGELLFSLADARRPSAGQRLEPLRIALQLTDRSGNSSRVALDSLQPLPPPLVIQYSKLGALERALMQPQETVLHSFRVPLESAAAGGLQLDEIGEIRFVFDPEQAGSILLDEIGYAARTSAR